MVQRSKRKKKKSTVTIKTINKLRGGFGIPRIPPGRAAAAAAAISPFARAALKAAAEESKNFGLEYASSVLKGTKTPDVVDVGTRIMGRMKGLASDVVSGTTGETVFAQVESTKNRYIGSAVPYREHFTTLETGRPSTRQMRLLAKMNGLKTSDFFNSEFNSTTDAPTRKQLRMETGFNQKYVGALGHWNWTAVELDNIYQQGTLLTPSNKLETIYGQMMNLHRTLKIMNTNSYLAANVILRCWRATNSTTGVATLLNQNEAVANPLTAVQIQGALPVQFQFTEPEIGGSLDICRVLMDPKASLHYSPQWKEMFEEVRTMRKKLKPGEIWNVKEIFSCGAGINLQTLRENRIEHAAAPVGYQWTIEFYGAQCQGIVGSQENVHIIGTAPCYIQCEMSKGYTAVLASSSGGSERNYEVLGGGGGIEDDRLAIRAFTRRFNFPAAGKRNNFGINSITNSPSVGAGQIYIPVMSDQLESYAKEAGVD